MRLLLFIFMTLACLNLHVIAQDIVIVEQGDLSTVNTAIINASPNTVIVMNAGVYTGCSTGISINKNVTIRGLGATISCDSGGFGIVTQSGSDGATIENLTILNAGIGIKHTVAGSLLNIINVTISFCTTLNYDSGAGIHVANSAVCNIFCSTLNNNTAYSRAGGIYASDVGTLVNVYNTVIMVCCTMCND